MSENCRVRGIGVAVSVSVSTLTLIMLQLFLCPDPEFLLLIDDQQAKVLEFDILADQPVGADKDVEFAFRQLLQGLFLLLLALEPVQVVDTCRENPSAGHGRSCNAAKPGWW